MAFPNRYTHRRVAEASAKACDICLKPSTSVLITDSKEDFFFVCTIHLTDTKFCTPDQEVLNAIQKRKREEMLEQEKENLLKEFEEKFRKKAEKEKNKEKEGDNDKTEDGKKRGDDGNDKDEVKKDAKETNNDASKDSEAEVGEKSSLSTGKTDDLRIFNLEKTFYESRLLRKKRREEAVRRARKGPTALPAFPSVPKHLPK